MKVGDRVRYRQGHPTNGDASLNGRLGTIVAGSAMPGHVTVDWDENRPYAPTKPFIENLELIVPETILKVGDRVRYHRTVAGTVENNGRIGTVTSLDSGCIERGHVTVKWDDGKSHPSYPYIANLEIIPVTKTLDTAKPLEVGLGQHGKTYAVPFITVTSEGHILVGKFPDAHADWFIFTAEGQFVRSSDGTGTGLTLRNTSVETVHYQRTTSANLNSGQYITDVVYQSLEQAQQACGTSPRQISKVTKIDGIIQSVERVK